jgi:NADH-quinone oxidoreductase subunit G
MVTVTIDGREVQVPDGTNLVEAAKQVGIEVPTYCYHPGLTVVGQCRICFVEVEGLPRLVTACSTPVKHGMVVFTDSQKVQDARAAVMEFLLENHPLDCPVCDQAGECYLQDYSVEHGLDTTHMVDERRTFPGYERRQIGPHVVQNQNRCIHCTRCIRVTEEIFETGDLTMKSRGNHSYIDTYDGNPLTSPWSACVADVCPVGALTVKEFRFRARVWHLDETPSVCPGCSIGCNIDIGHMKEVVYRFTPRENREVNGWWMCDYGRFLAESLNELEIERPTRRAGGEQSAVSWNAAVDHLKGLLADGSSRVVASANLSNEALYLVKTILAAHCGLEVVVPVHVGDDRRIKNGHREWIDNVDAHPNSTGARLLGLEAVDRAGLERFVASAEGPVVILDTAAHPWLGSDEAAAAVAGQEVVAIGRRATGLAATAGLALPAASWIETEGTYTSSTGRVQLARRGYLPKAGGRPTWEILHRLGVAVGARDAADTDPRRLFEELASYAPAFAGMTYARLRSEPGIPVVEEVPHVG